MQSIEAEPDEPHDRLGVLGDWLEDKDEIELARAARFAGKRPEVALERPTDPKYGRWYIQGVSYNIMNHEVPTVHNRSLAGAIAFAEASGGAKGRLRSGASVSTTATTLSGSQRR